MFFLRKNSKHKAFTISIPSSRQAAEADYVGIVRLSDFDPLVHNVEDFINYSSGIQAMSKKGYKNLEDKLDAFLCAYAACWLANRKGKVFGDDQDGFIAILIIDENGVYVGRSESIKVYNKLIRDKIPQIIEQSGKKAIIFINRASTPLSTTCPIAHLGNNLL